MLEMMDAVLGRSDIAAVICSATTKGGFDQVIRSLSRTADSKGISAITRHWISHRSRFEFQRDSGPVSGRW
jgi:hypothetical protein